MDKVKEIWNSPRYRSLIILGIYFIFFAVMFSMIKISPKKETEQNKYQKYEFRIEVNNEKINGFFDQNKIFFNYNDIDYVYKNDVLDPEDFVYFEVLNFLNIDKITNDLKKIELYSKTEYNDNTISKTYRDGNLEIITYEKDNEIYELDVDKYKIFYYY